jgi:hypothetical protein
MTVSFGRNSTFAFAPETAYNEAWGSPSLIGLYLDKPPEFVPNVDTIKEKHLTGRPELDLTDIAQGIKNYTLKIEGKIPKEAFGYLLLNLLGKVTTTAVATYYKHEFVPSVGTPPSLKIQIRNPLDADNYEWRLQGAIVKTLELTLAQNQFVKFSIDFVGGSFAKHTTLSAAPSVSIPSAVNPFYLWNSNADIELNAADTKVSSMTMTFESMLTDDIDDSYEFGSAERIRLERAAGEDAFKVRGNIKRILQGTEGYTVWNAFTTSTISVLFFDPTASDYYIDVDFAKAKILKLTHTPRGSDLFEETMEFEAFTSGTATDIKLTYQDKQALPATT